MVCEDNDSYMNGHWYANEETGQLYIMPNDQYGIADSYGPDDEIMSELNEIYRLHACVPYENIDQQQIADKLSLNIIYDWQKRGSYEEGRFYFA